MTSPILTFVQVDRRALSVPFVLAAIVGIAGLVHATAPDRIDRPGSTGGAKLEEEIAQASGGMTLLVDEDREAERGAGMRGLAALIEPPERRPEEGAGLTCAAEADSCGRRTPLSEEELAEALRSAYIELYGRSPPIDRLACAWAQCALETSRGNSVFEYNLGNITTSGAWNRSCLMRFYERSVQETDVWEPIELRFRAYETAREGALDYWRLLVEHYHSALAMCDEGDIMAAGLRLGQLGYFTTNATPYALSLVQLYGEARGRVLPRLPKIQKADLPRFSRTRQREKG